MKELTFPKLVTFPDEDGDRVVLGGRVVNRRIKLSFEIVARFGGFTVVSGAAVVEPEEIFLKPPNGALGGTISLIMSLDWVVWVVGGVV